MTNKPITTKEELFEAYPQLKGGEYIDNAFQDSDMIKNLPDVGQIFSTVPECHQEQFSFHSIAYAFNQLNAKNNLEKIQLAIGGEINISGSHFCSLASDIYYQEAKEAETEEIATEALAEATPCLNSPQLNHLSTQHYKTHAIEPIDFIMQNKLDFCEGNVIYSILQYKKTGDIKDLDEAKAYLEYLIKQLEVK